MDDYILDLDTNLTSNVVNADVENPTNFTFAEFGTAMLKLADRDIPRNELSLWLPPVGYWNGLYAEKELRDANKSGLPKSILLNPGYIDQIGGVPTFITTRVNKVGSNEQTRTCVLAHKSTFAIGVQKNGEIRAADRVAGNFLARVMVLHYLLGVITFREDHGARIHIRNTPKVT